MSAELPDGSIIEIGRASAIPREGEEVAVRAKTYRVHSVRWQLREVGEEGADRVRALLMVR